MSNSSKAARTREEILDAAWDLIAKEGAGVSLARIAEAAGMTRQSVYVHFGSRGGLLLALVKRADERFGIWEAMDEAMEARTAAARLDGCLAAWFEFVPRIHPVAMELIRRRSDDEDAANAWADRMGHLHALYVRLVKALKRQGALAPGWTVADAADHIWAGSSVQAWDLLVADRGWKPAKAAKVIRQNVLRLVIA